MVTTIGSFRCVDIDNEIQSLRIKSITRDDRGLKGVADLRQRDADRCWLDFYEKFPDGRPPKTIERRCETYIDNRGEQ